jgi:hypothetical protein
MQEVFFFFLWNKMLKKQIKIKTHMNEKYFFYRILSRCMKFETYVFFKKKTYDHVNEDNYNKNKN